MNTHEGHTEIQDEVEEEEVHHHPHHLQVKDHLGDDMTTMSTNLGIYDTRTYRTYRTSWSRWKRW